MPEANKEITRLSQILIFGEGNLYINTVREILESIPPKRLSEYILAADNFLFKSVLYYIRLFRRDQKVQDLINHPDFSIEALERIIIYLHYQFSIMGRPIDRIFADQLPAIDKDRILELLLKSSVIKKDFRIAMNLMSLLDRNHLENFIKQQKNPKEYLGNMIKLLPAGILRDFLYRNSDFYGYLKLFFMYDPESDEKVVSMLKNLEKDIEEAMKTLIIAKHHSDEKPEQIRRKHDAKRIIEIVTDLKKMEDPEKSLNLMAENDAFIDETEIIIVKNILLNPYFRDILDSIPLMTEDELRYFDQDDLLFF